MEVRRIGAPDAPPPRGHAQPMESRVARVVTLTALLPASFDAAWLTGTEAVAAA